MGGRRTLRSEPEQALVDRLLQWLRTDGWLAMHISDSRMVVNIAGRFCLVGDPECAGWPDIFAVSPATGRMVAIECKRPGRRPRADQVDWLDGLAGVGVETFVATPANEAEVKAGLAGTVPAAA